MPWKRNKIFERNIFFVSFLHTCEIGLRTSYWWFYQNVYRFTIFVNSTPKQMNIITKTWRKHSILLYWFKKKHYIHFYRACFLSRPSSIRHKMLTMHRLRFHKETVVKLVISKIYYFYRTRTHLTKDAKFQKSTNLLLRNKTK